MITLNPAQQIYSVQAQLIDSQIDTISKAEQMMRGQSRMLAMLDVREIAEDLGFTATVCLIDALWALPYDTRTDFWYGLIRENNQRCFGGSTGGYI
jgi:hypothetical protein